MSDFTNIITRRLRQYIFQNYSNTKGQRFSVFEGKWLLRTVSSEAALQCFVIFDQEEL